MATRRSPAAHRLVEGQTYQVPVARTTRSIGRSIKLVGPSRTAPHVFTNGAMVPSGPAAIDPHQKPVVGSIVTLKVTRRSRMPHGVLPGVDGYTYTSVFDAKRPFVVTELSEDGKYMRVVPLYEATNYSRIALVRSDSGWEFRLGALSNWDETTQRYVYATPTLTAELVRQYMRNATQLHGSASLYNACYARPSHIVGIYSPEHLPEELYAAHWDVERQAVRDRLYARLYALTPGAQFNNHRNYTEYHVRRREEAGKAVRSSIRGAIEYAKNGYNSGLNLVLDSANTRLRNVSARTGLLDLVAKINAKLPAEAQIRRAECQHWHVGTATRMHGYYGYTDYCPACSDGAVTAINTEGDEILVARGTTTYNWSDGTRRLTREPGIIGHRHSGKGIVGFVPSVTGVQRDNMITLGMELEMQAVDSHDREAHARALRNRLTNVLAPAMHRKYVHFEEDGSTGPGGFEMVTGYTDLATHAALLRAMFVGDNGKSPWVGKLRSHDAKHGSCGIHVHIQKPKHLVHASKMQYFINAAGSEKLVRDVARRYNDGFARINNDLCANNTPGQLAVQAVKAVKYDRGTTTPNHERMALNRMNGNRYEALNFQNPNTVEFRIFRGTTMYQSMMACLEFTQAVWLFTRDTAATQLTVDNFLSFINAARNKKDTRNLREYLAKRGWAGMDLPSEKKVAPAEQPGLTAMGAPVSVAIADAEPGTFDDPEGLQRDPIHQLRNAVVRAAMDAQQMGMPMSFNPAISVA